MPGEDPVRPDALPHCQPKEVYAGGFVVPHGGRPAFWHRPAARRLRDAARAKVALAVTALVRRGRYKFREITPGA